MSFVTDVILVFPSTENEIKRVKEVNSFSDIKSGNLNLKSIDEPNNNNKEWAWYGGSKFFSNYIYVGAFNHLNLESFLNHVSMNVNWEEPEYVQLFIGLENEYTFRVYNNAGSSLVVDSVKT